MRGLLRARSASSSLRIIPIRSIVNASAPRSDTTASDQVAFIPWISDTTVMIDDTATMLPRSVSSDRSLFAQIELRASRIDSRICAIDLAALTRLGHLDEIAVEHVTDRIERAGDHAVALLQAVGHLEI